MSSLNEVIAALAQTTNLKLLRSEMPWVTNPDTAVEVTEASSEALDTLVAQIQEHVDVQAVYVNSR